MDTEEVKSEKTIEELIKLLKPEHKIWADNFLRLGNKTKASIATGYIPNSAATTGMNIYSRPEVKEYISFCLAQYIGEPEESVKLLRSIAETDVSNYMVPVKRPRRDWIKVPVADVITELQNQLDIENEFFLEFAETPKEQTASLKKSKQLKKDIGLLKIELSRNPKAKKIILGPEYLATEMVLDLQKVCADKDQGRIKTYKVTKEGVQVEMYDAKDAAIQLLRISGKYEKDNKRDVNFNLENADIIFK